MTLPVNSPPLAQVPAAEEIRERRLVRVKRKVGRIWTDIWEDEVFDRAAALSYYFIFALFPMLLFVTAALGMLRPDLVNTLMGMLDTFLPTDVVHRTMTEVMQNASGGLLSLGIAAALWSAASGMSALMTAVNVAFDLKDPRPWWRRQLVALCLTAGAASLILIGLLLLLFGDTLDARFASVERVGPLVAAAWSVGRWILIIAMLNISINLIFYLAVPVRPRWRLLTPGSTFVVVAWVLMSLLLRVVLDSFVRLGATYGSIGGTISLLMWLYWTGVLIFVGAEIDAEIGRGWEAVKEVVKKTV
jgi:membrane protein